MQQNKWKKSKGLPGSFQGGNFFRSKIRWFQRPEDVDPGTILIFPRRLDRRCCGLAGIVEIVKKPHLPSLAKLEVYLEKIADLISPNQEEGSAENSEEVLLEQMDDITGKWKALGALDSLFSDKKNQETLGLASKKLQDHITTLEKRLYGKDRPVLSSQTRERLNSLLIHLRDLHWRMDREILANLPKIEGLIYPGLRSAKVLLEMGKINGLLNNLDRLEIRGRDSAGFSALIYFDSIEDFQRVLSVLKEKKFQSEWDRRQALSDFVHGAIYVSQRENSLCFVFKVAEEIGKLGDNIAYLRKEVTRDEIFQLALSQPGGRCSPLAHTRWASNGIINVSNCHPMDNFVKKEGRFQVPDFSPPHKVYGKKGGYLNVVLNGDIDNFLDLRDRLKEQQDYSISPQITTDAKVIPLQIQKYLADGHNLKEAFRLAVSDFSGSSAIAMQSDLEPGNIYLSLKGSGQSIYVGLGRDSFVFASEIYGLVEETSQYIKMDGEALADPYDPQSSGQIFVIHQNSPGGLEGLEAFFHNKTPLELSPSSIKKAEITTRDIDRKGLAHFFIKEIGESPQSVLKTVLGKFSRKGNEVEFHLGQEILPPSLLDKLVSQKIRKIYVIGQGTAGIAAMAIGAFLQKDLKSTHLVIQGLSASEMSGFQLSENMEDSLVIAVTQSGTTTDTNNAVEMVKKRGASTLAIVNRRNSDITYKVDGVFYTSDGRDVEMSVASTKAFYSQVVAGILLSLKLAQLLSSLSASQISEEVSDLETLPSLMNQVLKENQPLIAQSARQYGPTRRHWAIVGSGLNHISAREVRIKLSELCYKSIACDYVEDKKHIDLSSEPLIIVCAGGSHQSVLRDIIKDVAIFKAHKSLPIVFASHQLERFHQDATEVIPLPTATAKVSLILNTLAGHLWGYYAALAIHEEGQFMAQIRQLVVREISQSGTDRASGFTFETMQKLDDFSIEFHKRKRAGRFQGALKTNTAVDLALLFKYGTNKLPLVDFQREFGKIPTANHVMETLLDRLNRAVEELLRPIDAIKHQAKTVTVGTSRLEFPKGSLFDIARELDMGLEEVEVENINLLKQVQPAIQKIKGYSLYKIENLNERGKPTDQTRISILTKGGIAKELKSRLEAPSPLVGNKRSVVQSRKMLITIGKTDGRHILLLPLLGKNFQIEKLLLYQISFEEKLPLKKKRAVLSPYFYEKVKNTVMEANIDWRDEFLENLSPQFLLTEPAEVVAEKILGELG